MLYYYTNNSISLRILGGRYWYSKKYSYDQKTSNLAFLSAKKKCTADKIILISIKIIMVILDLSLILLGITNIRLQSYYF